MKTTSGRLATSCTLLLLLPTLFVAGCASTASLTTTGPIPAGSLDTRAGLRYFLPRDLVEVSATQTITVTASPAPDLSKRQVKEEIKHDVSVDLESVADLRTYYLLDLEPSAFEDFTLEAKVSDRGFLSSINADSTGRVGDVIQNVVKLASIFVPGGGFLDAESTEAWPNPAPKCIALDLRTLPILDHLLVKRNEEGCTLWHQLERNARRIAKLELQLQIKNVELAKAPASEVATLISKIEVLEKQIARLVRQRRALEATFEAKRKELAKKLELGSETKKESVTALLDPSELPSADDVYPGMDKDVAKGKLTSIVAKNLLEKVGVVVTLQEIPKVACDPETGQPCQLPANPQPSTSDCNKGPANGMARIYYRQSQPRVLTTLLVGKNEKLQLEKQQVVEIIDARDAARCLDFESSGFSVRKLQIAFDARGRPTTLTRSSTSSAAGLTGALADAAVTARDTYTETLEKLATAETHKRTLALADVTTEIEVLKKEKELLDAQLALEGATANQDLVLEQQQLAAQLAVLEAQLELQQSQAGFDLQLEIAQLKLQLEQLQQQLGVLNARLALEEAQKK